MPAYLFENPVSAGKLRIRYTAAVSSKQSEGAFRVKDLDRWYLYTQFEPISARKVFPCFDEPNYKVPWQLTLEVPKQHSAFSNTPPVSEKTDGATKTIAFAKTRPLPSYLVAFAVGTFEIVPARAAGSRKIPMRIIVPAGRTAEAAYAAQVTPDILDQLENYFGIPYPYPKLDSIAVPLFPGAMENPGLITYGQTLILSKPSEDGIQRQRGYAHLAAHEMGHQWFGDLVTTEWWNDIWLNEAFATWIANRTLREWKPEWGIAVAAVNERQGAMNLDSLITARRIRQPIETNSDITNAFDGITYQKGGAVIGMFEHWVGPQNFRRGVKAYLDQYSDRNADAAKFLEAVGRGAGREIRQQFDTFLDQPGVPLVSLALRCDPGKPVTVELSQKRLLPEGSKGSKDQKWSVPVCAAWESGGAREHDCTLLTSTSASWELSKAKSCPAWIIGNSDGAGYYQVRYEGDLLEKLTADAERSMTVPERVSTIGDVSSLVGAGELPAAAGLRLIPEFSKDPNRFVAQRSVTLASSINRDLVPSELRPNYARFVTRMFAERARELGWKSKPGEDAETRLLRPILVGFAAAEGNAPELQTEARQLALAWLSDHSAVDADVAPVLLKAAAAQGDEALFNAFLKAAKASKDEKTNDIFLPALSSFRQPELARRGLEVMLSPDFDIRQSFWVLSGPMFNAGTKQLPYEFVRSNYDRIIERVGPVAADMDLAASLPFVAGGLCSADKAAEVRAFFADKMKTRMGGERNLNLSIENMELCGARVRAQQSGVAAFLRQY